MLKTAATLRPAKMKGTRFWKLDHAKGSALAYAGKERMRSSLLCSSYGSR